MPGADGTKWTAPRYAGDHLPESWYAIRRRQIFALKNGGNKMLFLLKVGHPKRFEVGFHLRMPDMKAILGLFAVNFWVRIA